jgi:hypothetical protein
LPDRTGPAKEFSSLAITKPNRILATTAPVDPELEAMLPQLDGKVFGFTLSDTTHVLTIYQHLVPPQTIAPATSRTSDAYRRRGHDLIVPPRRVPRQGSFVHRHVSLERGQAMLDDDDWTNNCPGWQMTPSVEPNRRLWLKPHAEREVIRVADTPLGL